jgi:hypothetical protein
VWQALPGKKLHAMLAPESSPAIGKSIEDLRVQHHLAVAVSGIRVNVRRRGGFVQVGLSPGVLTLISEHRPRTDCIRSERSASTSEFDLLMASQSIAGDWATPRSRFSLDGRIGDLSRTERSCNPRMSHEEAIVQPRSTSAVLGSMPILARPTQLAIKFLQERIVLAFPLVDD